MKKIVLFLIVIISTNIIYAQESIKKDELYIQTYARFAVEEMELYKIPASITLAQGILETGNGQSDLAQYANNHFGIKCKDEWVGERMYHDDDLKGECFRKYSSVRESYRDHSLFLANRSYYKKLFYLDEKDYKAWAFGLKQAGYATNSKYAYILINLIERYHLDQFDQISLNEVDAKLAEMFPNLLKNSTFVKSEPKSINSLSKNNKENTNLDSEIYIAYKGDPKQESSYKRNKSLIVKANNFEFPSTRVKIHPNGNLKFIVIKEGDNLEDISKAYNISLKNLKLYNDLAFQEELKINQKIFLEPKKNAGTIKKYTVKEGDKMYDVAQNNGVSLIELYKRNLMHPGQEPKKGDIILLKGKRS